jgi:glycine/D-amino acid oxidase-like deaminating enzyme
MVSGSPDVAVIGAGIVGVSVAEELAAAGASVAVYEATAVAAAASGRNSGVVQYPLDPVLEELHLGTLDCYRRLSEEERGAFRMDTEPSGLMLVGRDAARLRLMTDELAATHPHLRPEFVAAGEVTRLERAIAEDVAACRLAVGYPVAPASATRAIAARAERAGARFVIGEDARPRFDRGRASGVVLGDRFEAAGSVVVAAGPWSPEVIDPTGLWRPIRRLWGVVVEVDLEDPPGHVLEEAGVDIEPGAQPVEVGGQWRARTSAWSRRAGSAHSVRRSCPMSRIAMQSCPGWSPTARPSCRRWLPRRWVPRARAPDRCRSTAAR